MDETKFDASGLLAKAEQVRAQSQAAHRAELARQLEEPRVTDSFSTPVQGALPFPGGFVGALAQFIYQQAPRPVAEVAIVGALGLMAGIAGRDWSISGTGLNLYVVLVARSGIGKEAMHSGIAKVINAGMVECPEVGTAVDFSDYASGPALVKAIGQNPAFVNVAGEIGHKFMEMAEDKGGSPMRSYRKVLTDLYAKSGPHSIAGGIAYSNQECNVASVVGAAFSLIGETTPSKFYNCLTPSMMEDGFMSRFCVIEYTGDRPDENGTHSQAPWPELVAHFNVIFKQGMLVRARGQFMTVAVAVGAQTLLDHFSAECDHKIRAAGDDEGIRQLWNRAHLKALRVSGLLAVGDNPFNPVVTDEQASWAITLIRHGIVAFERRIRTGEVGEGTDGGREQKVLDLCREFLTLPADKLPAWLKDGEAMQQSGIVPRRYLQQRTQRLASFEKHKLQHTAALNITIKTAITNGNLKEVKGDKLAEQFNYHGQAYRVLDCRT